MENSKKHEKRQIDIEAISTPKGLVPTVKSLHEITDWIKMEFDNSINLLKSDQKNLIDTVVERVNTTVEEAKKNMKFETTSLAEELKSIRTMLAEQIVNIEILSTNIGELSSKLDMLILNNERNEKKWEDFNETLRDLEDILDDLKFQQRKIIEKLPP